MLGKSTRDLWQSKWRFAAVLSVGLAGYGAGTLAAPAAQRQSPFTLLWVTGKTVMDEPIVYPASGPAELTAGILSLQPGEVTPWHTHGVPLAGIVLEGEITVDYGDKGQRSFKTGEAIAEAMAVPHRGMNKTDHPLRVFVLHMGAQGVPLTTPVER